MGGRAMSSDLGDWLVDHEWSNVSDWLETEQGWKAFGEWLWDKEQDSHRDALIELFLARVSAERLAFNEWAIERFYTRENPDADGDGPDD
jgi:hypothetical protein